MRLYRESRILAQLTHENIATIYTVELLDNSCPAVVMEFLQGEDLLKHLLKGGPLSFQKFRQIFSEVSNALSYAHSMGVVHRDLSTANIFLSENPTANAHVAKVIDFGLARILDREDSPRASMQLTKTGMLLGNPAYMSPEQCRGEVPDPQSDIYALGCIMYESLAGKPPFVGSSAVELLVKHQSEFAPKLSLTWSDTMEVKLCNYLILKCLQKEKAKRFQSAEEILEILSSNPAEIETREYHGLQQWEPHGMGSTKHKSRLFPLLICIALLSTCIIATINMSRMPDSLALEIAAILKGRSDPLPALIKERVAANLSLNYPANAVPLYSELLEGASTKDPDKVLSFRQSLASIYLRLGKLKESSQQYKQMALARNGSTVNLEKLSSDFKNLGLIYANKPSDDDEIALRAAMLRVLNAQPNSDHHLTSNMVFSLLKSCRGREYNLNLAQSKPDRALVSDVYDTLIHTFNTRKIYLNNDDILHIFRSNPKQDLALFAAALKRCRFRSASDRNACVSCQIENLCICGQYVEASEIIENNLSSRDPSPDNEFDMQLLLSLANIELRLRRFEQANRHIRKVIDFQEKQPIGLADYAVFSMLPYEILAKTEQELHGLEATHKVCLKAIDRLPSRELWSTIVQINTSVIEVDLHAANRSKREGVVQLGQRAEVHHNFQHVVQLCARHEQSDLLIACLRQYILLLQQFHPGARVYLANNKPEMQKSLDESQADFAAWCNEYAKEKYIRQEARTLLKQCQKLLTY